VRANSDGTACVRKRFLRIFGGTMITRDGRPGDLRPSGATSIGVNPPLKSYATVTPPAGYSVTLGPVTNYTGSFTCKAPGRVHASPTDDAERDEWSGYQPKRVQWVLSNPPVFGISGEQHDGAGSKEPYTEYYRACGRKPLSNFRLLRPRLWAEHVTITHAPTAAQWTEEWLLWIDSTPIGIIGGDEWSLSISP
jgi:hypothetical protein